MRPEVSQSVVKPVQQTAAGLVLRYWRVFSSSAQFYTVFSVVKAGNWVDTSKYNSNINRASQYRCGAAVQLGTSSCVVLSSYSGQIMIVVVFYCNALFRTRPRLVDQSQSTAVQLVDPVDCGIAVDSSVWVSRERKLGSPPSRAMLDLQFGDTGQKHR